jgi:hypothetical protein
MKEMVFLVEIFTGRVGMVPQQGCVDFFGRERNLVKFRYIFGGAL